jgi:hypothetical protein
VDQFVYDLYKINTQGGPISLVEIQAYRSPA